MKKSALIVLMLLCLSILNAQDANFKWAKQFVGSGSMSLSSAMAVDNLGNIYTTGHFGRTVDFDPGPGVYNLTRPYIGYDDDGYDDMFVCKLDAAGNFIWARQIAANEDYKGTEALSIALDTAGNSYTTGFFYGTVDFDPGPCNYELTTLADAREIFVLKLSSEGEFKWVKRMSAANSSYAAAHFISLDSSGNIYTAGRFNGTMDFDPGIGNSYLSQFGQGVNGLYNSVFISKLDPDGNFIWAKQMTGNSTVYLSAAVSIAFDAVGDLYATGAFNGSVDFDPGSGVYNLSAQSDANAFVLKLDNSGNFLWARQIAGNDTSTSWSRSISIDKSGNIITGGGFWGTIDFDPGSGVINLTSTINGRTNMFMLKLDSGGGFVWAKGIGGTSDYNNPSGGPSGGVYLNALALDPSGNIYSAGYFEETVDFDPGPGVFSLTNAPDLANAIWPGLDMFVSKLDSNGNFVWSKQMTTTTLTYTRQTYCSSLKLDNYGNIYTSGGFIGLTDFDPGLGTYNLSAPWGDIFIHKMSPCVSGSTTSSISASSCKKYLLNGHTYTSSGTFTQTILNRSGCDSIITLNLSISRPETTMHVTACDSYTHCRTNMNCTVCVTYDSTGVYTDTLTTGNGCDSLVHLNVTIKNNAVDSISVVTCNSFSWRGQIYTSSGIYSDTLTSSNGCDSIVRLKLVIDTVRISAEPQDIKVCAGSDGFFSVAASGVLAYQWQLSTDGGISFRDIPSANAASLAVIAVTAMQHGYSYRCCILGACSEIISSVAGLTVIEPVNIIHQPQDFRLCSGENASFSVTGSSIEIISFQWQVSHDGGATYFSLADNQVYAGAATSVLTISGAIASMNGYRYRCLLSGTTCAVPAISNSATLSVQSPPTVKLAADPLTSLMPGQSTILTATPQASAGGNLSMNWYYNNTGISNVGNTRTVNFEQVGTYMVRIRESAPGDHACFSEAVITIGAQNGSRVIIFPNPNAGNFHISYYNSGGVHNLKAVMIYDSKGAKVHHEEFVVTGLYTVLNLNINLVSAGLYSVVLADTNGERIAVGRILITR